MVTLGSLLLWAMLRVLVPNNSMARTVVAVGSSVVLLKTGNAYLQVIDDAVAKKRQRRHIGNLKVSLQFIQTHFPFIMVVYP